MSRSDRCSQGGIGTRQLFGRALEMIVRREHNGFTLDEFNLVGIVGKETGTNLGALGVEQDCCMVAGGCKG